MTTTREWRYGASPTIAEANQVLFAFDAGGYRAGGFFAALIDAMAKADTLNLGKLALAFPGLASAVYVAQVDGGLDQLRVVAGPDFDPH